MTSATIKALKTDELMAREARGVFLWLAIVGGGFLAASTLLPFAGAVPGSGTVVIDGNVKTLQHQQGGTIGAILVKEGVAVREGDVVARLDDTATKANLGVVMADINAQAARLARLEAERDDRTAVVFPSDLQARAARDAGLRLALDNERRLFDTRRLARDGQKSQLVERIGQFEKEIEGMREQYVATDKQNKIAVAERALLDPLIAKGLVQRPRITQLDREIERNKGILGDATARIQQSQKRISETQVQIAQIDRERFADSTKELREAEARLAEGIEKRTAAEDQLRKIEIKAPVGGVVHELKVHTIGGVINPAEPLMTIVPNPDDLVIEVKVSPNDRDQIAERKDARVRFTAFNQRVTPELKATVSRISPNTSRDQQTGMTYYTVGIALLPGQLALLGGQRLAPGMMAETFITTDDRTVLGFLTKQFRDYWAWIFLGR